MFNTSSEAEQEVVIAHTVYCPSTVEHSQNIHKATELALMVTSTYGLTSKVQVRE